MAEQRLKELTPESMTPEQRRVADAIQSGPRGVGLRGPFNALLRSPDLADAVQKVGEYVRFKSSIPQRLNELAIIIAVLLDGAVRILRAPAAGVAGGIEGGSRRRGRRRAAADQYGSR